MQLSDCTKAELLWVIQRADKLDREYLKIMREVDKL